MVHVPFMAGIEFTKKDDRAKLTENKASKTTENFSNSYTYNLKKIIDQIILMFSVTF